MVQSIRPLSPFSITQEAPPLNHRRRERAHAAWHDLLPDPLAQDDSIDEGQPFAYEHHSRAGPTIGETSASFTDPQGFSYEQFGRPQSNPQAGSSSFPKDHLLDWGSLLFQCRQGFLTDSSVSMEEIDNLLLQVFLCMKR